MKNATQKTNVCRKKTSTIEIRAKETIHLQKLILEQVKDFNLSILHNFACPPVIPLRTPTRLMNIQMVDAEKCRGKK